jgi:hypothetical protein
LASYSYVYQLHAENVAITDVISPFIVFSGLDAVACHFVFGHLYQSNLDVAIANACASGRAEAAPYRLRYVGLDAIDSALCFLVTFFQTAINFQDSLAFATYFIGVGAPLIVVPAVESWRAGRSLFIAYPVLFGVLYQIMTVGWTMPLYWLIFILTGGTKSRHPNRGNTNISKAAAEAIVFSIIVGAAIPSVGMLVFDDPYVTAIWQPFPIYISLAQRTHLLFRPLSKYPQSGYQTIRGLYIATFILCSSVHIATIWPLIGDDLRTLSRVFIASIVIIPTTMEHGVHHLLKWDFSVAFASSILVTFWFASSKKQLALLVAWSVFATPVFGPGAAMMGAFLWREASLQG